MSAKLAPALVAVALCTALATASCSRAPHAAQPVPAAQTAVPALRTTGWVVTGGRVSVLVRNVGNSAIGSARAVISGRDRHGNVVATISGAQCCTVTGLVPGATAGIYADLGQAAQRVSALSVHWTAADPAMSPPLTVQVADVGMRAGRDQTVVTVSLTSPTARAVRTQAILRSATGALVAVLTGRPTCLAAGRHQPASMRVAQVLPPGTVVQSITTYPVADAAC
jgi:hypothetical protein